MSFSFRLARSVGAWITQHISEQNRLLLLSILTGLVAGCAAVTLKILVHSISRQSAVGMGANPLIIAALPSVGILLSILFVRFIVRQPAGTTADILLAIMRKSSLVERFKLYSHFVGSALTVGFGGSAGLESPIAITGAAIGSNIGRIVNYRHRTLLLSCGAAAGIAAVFNAPIAGILFAIEVLLVDVSLSSIIPLVVASVAGSLCSIVLQQNEILFEFSRIPSFDFHNVPFYFGLGLVCAMVSLLYLATIQKLQNVFKAFHPILRWGIASIGMFGIVALVAPVRGEGYSVIQLLGQGRADMVPGNLPFSMEPRGYLLAFFIVMILAKILATALTLRSGGIGGSFAPSLFIGACTGFVLARGLNLLHPEFLPESNFTIVGMAGMLSGIMYAPLTGVFLIAEATGGYNLIVPLLLVSAVTHLIVIQFLPHSIESTEMTAQGVAPTQRRDVQILGEMQVKNLVETDFASLPHNGFLGDLVAAVARSKRSLFPVLADGQKLAGIVNLNDVTGIIFRTELYETVTIASIMIQPPATIDLHENMRDAMERFDQTGAWNLPVIESGKYKGFVSRSRIFQAYRHELKNA